MWQGKEYDVVTAKSIGARLFQDSIGQLGQVRSKLPQGLPSVTATSKSSNSKLARKVRRVIQQQSKNFATCVPAGSCNCYARRHAIILNEYAASCNLYIVARRRVADFTAVISLLTLRQLLKEPAHHQCARVNHISCIIAHITGAAFRCLH